MPELECDYDFAKGVGRLQLPGAVITSESFVQLAPSKGQGSPVACRFQFQGRHLVARVRAVWWGVIVAHGLPPAHAAPEAISAFTHTCVSLLVMGVHSMLLAGDSQVRRPVRPKTKTRSTPKAGVAKKVSKRSLAIALDVANANHEACATHNRATILANALTTTAQVAACGAARLFLALRD